MSNLFSRFVKCESGATAIEYGLIASLIGVAIITTVTALGSQIGSTFASATKRHGKPSKRFVDCSRCDSSLLRTKSAWPVNGWALFLS